MKNRDILLPAVELSVLTNSRLPIILKPVENLFPLQAIAKLVNFGFVDDISVDQIVVTGKL